MKLEQIIVIAIPCIIIIGTVVIHLVEFFQKNDSTCKVWAEQWDDTEVIKYIKDDLIKQGNEELRKAIKLTSCTSKQFEEELNQMRTCATKPTFKEVVDTMSDKQKEVMNLIVNPPVSDDVLTFEATMSPNDMRKMLGLDEIEEHEAIIEDFTIKKAESVVDNPLHDDVEPKSKKLQPLLCKMCGGTVAKNGDNYECEYCGLKYEWR